MSEERNWPEDAKYENGNYQNTCHYCHSLFVGYKRRLVCKSCSNLAIIPLDETVPARNQTSDILLKVNEIIAYINRAALSHLEERE